MGKWIEQIYGDSLSIKTICVYIGFKIKENLVILGLELEHTDRKGRVHGR